MLGRGGDDGLWTVESLRGRLVAERAASKAARAEADLMAKRVAELERQLAEEMKSMNRAERRLEYALRKLESLKLSGDSGRSNLSESSSSSPAFSSGHQTSEGGEPGSETADSRQCGSTGEAGEMPRLSDSVDLRGDDGSGDSSVGSPLQVVSKGGSWSSVGTDYSCSEGAPRIDEADRSLDPHDSITDAARHCSVSGNKPVSMKHQPELRDDTRDAVPASLRPSSGAYKREINSGVHCSLVTLRHVRDQPQVRL